MPVPVPALIEATPLENEGYDSDTTITNELPNYEELTQFTTSVTALSPFGASDPTRSTKSSTSEGTEASGSYQSSALSSSGASNPSRSTRSSMSKENEASGSYQSSEPSSYEPTGWSESSRSEGASTSDYYRRGLGSSVATSLESSITSQVPSESTFSSEYATSESKNTTTTDQS